MSGLTGVAERARATGVPAPSWGPVAAVAAGVLALLTAAIAAVAVLAAQSPMRAAGESRVAELSPPLRFESNAGQVDPRARFVARDTDYSLFLTPSAAVVALPGTGEDPAHSVHVAFADADPDVELTGVERLPGETSYFTGDADVTGVPGYAAVDYQGLYPGIDVRFHEREGGELEYVFTVEPGADPEQIGLAVEGAEPSLAADGDLVLSTPAGELRQSAPVLYQEIDGQRREVAGSYTLRDGGEVGFDVGEHDPSRPLVIDPVLDYSTYLGGRGRDRLIGVAVDDDGAAYVTGHTTSPDFPVTPGAVQEDADTSEPVVIVTKLSPDGTDVAYSTYLGGSGRDTGEAVAVDDDGAAHVTGTTDSDDLPTTAGALQEGFQGGDSDAFLVKLAPDGSAVEHATYLGGGGQDEAYAVAVDDDGAAHVAGNTGSDDFPTTGGALAEDLPAGGAAFVTKLAADGSEAAWSTYLGGDGADSASGVAVDGDGAVYVGGDTRSADFPTTDGAFQAEHPSDTCETDDDPDRLCRSGYVVKLDNAGDQVYGTFVGGPDDDMAGSSSPAHSASQTLDVTSDGSAVLVGGTQSIDDFPLTDGALQTDLPERAVTSSWGLGYLTRLDADGSGLAASTFIGLTPVNHVHVADDGTHTVATWVESDAMPTRDRVAIYSGNHNTYVARIDADATDLSFGSHLGGRRVELVQGMAVGPDEAIYLVGDTHSDDFPTTPGALISSAPGALSGSVSRIAPTPDGEPLVTGLSPRSGPEEGGSEVTITGRDLSEATDVAFGDTPAEDVTVESDERITATSPAGTGAVPVTVTTPEGTSPANPVSEFTYAHGQWELTGEMSTIRFDGSLTLLSDGRVLAAGGRTEIAGGATVASVELYDPLTGEWSDTAAMSEPRSHHSATLLPDGRVLVAGGMGEDGRTGLAGAEVFDPDDETWTETDDLADPRGRHVAVTLDDGRPLVVGGQSEGVVHAGAEVYDPDADSWRTAGAMGTERTNFAGDVLADGRVLVAGGSDIDRNTLASAEVYDPDADAWSEVTPMAADRSQHQGATLADGRVLMASGLIAGRTAEVYDPDADAWTPSAMIHDRWTALLGTLPDGRVMLAGGTDGGPYAELYEPETNQWAAAGVMHRARPSWRGGHRNDLVTLSADPDGFAADPDVCGDHCGKVLAAGNTVTREAELYTPPEAPEPEPEPDAVTRVAGENRFDTAARLSAAAYPDGTDVAYVATGVDFPDALAGGVAAALDEAPVLLVTTSDVPQPTADELARLDVERVIVLGGSEVIDDGVEARLETIAGDVDRLAGPSRFATAAAVSEAAFPDGAGTAYLATGGAFPDALAAVSAAADAGAPLLLAATDGLTEPTEAELARLDPDRIVLLGGTAALDESVAAAAGELAGTVDRLDGPTRFHTAAAIATDHFDQIDDVIVATGEDFPDALAGGAIAGNWPVPVLLAAADDLTDPTRDAVGALGAQRATLLGGTAALSTAVEDDLGERLSTR